MHSFLKSIGFGNIKYRDDVEKLINLVIENAAEKHVAKLNDTTFAVEMALEVAENMGVIVRGEHDSRGCFHPEHYFPYFIGRDISTTEQICITKRVDSDSFTAMCDDYRLGVSLIFYLQNVVDYLNCKRKEKDPDRRAFYPIMLSALASEGKILLPTQRTEKQLAEKTAETIARTKLIAEAKQGNQEAIESLTIEDIDQYAMVSRRVRYEDIYSIVDTTFIPYGSESDNYSLLGNISKVRRTENAFTHEEVYILSLTCNDMDLEVCINKNDLLGEPLPGRRFRGTVWLQGTVDFSVR